MKFRFFFLLWILIPAVISAIAGEGRIVSNAEASESPFETRSRPVFNEITSLAGSRDAVLLADPTGRVVFAINEKKLLVPASILKLLTSLTVFHHLGEDFQFKTEFYLDSDKNLKMKGYGDPLLISEVMAEMASVLSGRISSFHDLIVDTGYFGEPLLIPGVTTSLEPYDSPNGALCANFNTVCFKQEKPGRFISAELQTPLVPFVMPKIRRCGLREGRILLSNENDECALYAGHLFSAFLSSHKIASSGVVRTGAVNKFSDRLILTYTSEYTLSRIVKQLLQYSNNYIANQLLIAGSAAVLSDPGTLEKGVDLLRAFAKNELGISDLELVEGSGISRGNRISAEAMLKVLLRFTPHAELMRREGNVYYKTGTLTDVRSRAGYIVNSRGEYFPFVIMVNTRGKSDKIILNHLLKAVKFSGTDG